jgi:glycerol-3-phosphate dehydrogenase
MNAAMPGPTRSAGLDGERFDAVVIGGGILGAAIARDLGRRGRRTLLLERMDFGWGTTNRCTRLIHGGLRYLEQLDFGLVREGLRERGWLLRAVPHLVQPLPMVLALYGMSAWRRLQFRAGLTLYDLFALDRSLPRHRHLGVAELTRLVPGIATAGLPGAMLFHDAQVELPERLVIEALRAAQDRGAVVRNHVAATGLLRQQGRVTGVEITDALSGEMVAVRAPLVINAAGPWLDSALAALGIERRPLQRLTQGIHLAYPRVSDQAVCLQHPDDGRLVFLTPWRGMTLAGTTDVDVSGPDQARITEQEVRYVARSLAFAFPEAGGRRARGAALGVRSLLRQEGRPSAVTRRHVVVDHAADGAAGLYTLVGGKLTAFRSIAAEVVDRALGERDRGALGAGPLDLEVPADPGGKADPATRRLWRLYGARADEVRRWVAQDPWWGEPLLDGQDGALPGLDWAIRAEVAHALTDEWAVTVADVVNRRLALGFGPDLGRAAAEAVAGVGVSRFGWDAARVQAELAAFDAEAREHRVPDEWFDR